MLELKAKTNKFVLSLFALMSTCKMNGFIIISAILVISFLSVIGSQQSLQKAIAQNMTMMMENKTTADTLMTAIWVMQPVVVAAAVAVVLTRQMQALLAV